MSRFSSLAFAALLLSAAAADAQWIKLQTPGIPRTPDGTPNLKAPAPACLAGPISRDCGDSTPIRTPTTSRST